MFVCLPGYLQREVSLEYDVYQMLTYLQGWVMEHSMGVVVRVAFLLHSLSTEGIKQRAVKLRVFKKALSFIQK